MTTPTDTAALRAAAEAAIQHGDNIGEEEWYDRESLPGPNMLICGPDVDYVIAASPITILALLDELDQLRMENENHKLINQAGDDMMRAIKGESHE